MRSSRSTATSKLFSSLAAYGAVLLFAASSVLGQMPGQKAPGPPPAQIEKTAHGFTASTGEEVVAVTACTDSVIHVIATPDASAAASPRPWMLDPAQSCPGAGFIFAEDAKAVSIKTAQVEVIFDRGRGSLSFGIVSGESLLKEGSSMPRSYQPVQLNGDHTYRVTDRFSPSITEALYGLGQHQSGLFNYRGATVELAQNNTDVAIPLLISSKGYGLMWNTAALTFFDNRFPLEVKLSSIAGKSIDYYFLYGPEMDTILHEYRIMTGHTPLLPKWAYGFFQSKDRYISLDEIREIAERYRQEHIPLDVIVQDWFWWKTEGDPVFNSNYHDVVQDLRALHKENVHAMISVWGLLDPKSETYKVLDARNELVPSAHVYDATNSEARDIYWEHLPGELLAEGWDAFWLDSAEPEEYWPHMGDAILSSRQVAIGNGAEFTNVFPLVHTLGVQDHWKVQDQSKRVFLLTRSAFLGQQRVGAVVWSGDVYGTYWGLSHQVPAGLNFALSGYPYWTTDIGGYWPPHDDPLTDPAFQELYVRWFEYGTFCPIFRTHGHRPHNELWSFDKVEPILVTYDRLRYRLMPYIYSLAWKVTTNDYTIQRPLVMDWRTDSKTWDLGDQFMFGPAILVNPVLKANATKRNVYLPAAAAWYDFWTGESFSGGHEIEADAPLNRMPLFVRAGAILPMGPQIEYATQDPAGTIELRIYRGADGKFDLYEDAGDGYEYQQGQHSVIPLRWDDRSSVLTIGLRQGSYPGMVERRKFRLVLVGNGHGSDVDVTSSPNAEIDYDGKEIQINVK
jgi:alpha-D-xyloside xylohydrolase